MSGKKRYENMGQRLLANSVLDPVTGCWVWTAARDKRSSTPYGKITVWVPGRGRTKRQAHIVSYETFVGPVADGYEVDHECRYGFCICPDHLRAVLPSVNKDRRILHRPKSTEVTYDPRIIPFSSSLLSDVHVRDLLGEVQYHECGASPDGRGDLVSWNSARRYIEHASMARESLDAA